MRISKAGYFGGDPSKVMDAPAYMVLNILNFEAFEKEYETAFTHLNRKEDI